MTNQVPASPRRPAVKNAQKKGRNYVRLVEIMCGSSLEAVVTSLRPRSLICISVNSAAAPST